MKLYLDKPNVEYLQSVISSPNPEYEYEFRIGYFGFDRAKNTNVFKSSQPKHVFNRVVTHYSKLYNPQVSNSVVKFYQNNIREIDGVYQRKTAVSKHDIDLYHVGCRFSVAREEKLNDKNYGDVTYTRERQRTSFKFSNYTIDASVVTDTKGDKTYELEIEYNNISSLKITDLIAPLKEILGLIYPEKISLITKSEYLTVVREYNTIFEQYIRAKNIRVPYGKIVRYENKPRNLKRADMSNMHDYSATNKLNGTGMYMMIGTGGIYLLNNTTVDKVTATTMNKYLKTVIQGEFFKGEFHIFDALYFAGKDLTSLYHSQRIEPVKTIISELSTLLSQYMPTEIKTFLSSGDLSQDTVNIMKYMYNRYGGDAIEENDGIMYTPEKSAFIGLPILKFKFPSTMTIDFTINNRKSEDDGDYYDVFTYGKDNVLSQFKGMKMFVEKKLQQIYDNGLVVECVYDPKRKLFIPTRIRHDKELPNFYGVATDVFEDIMNPLAVEDVVQSFKTKSEGYCLDGMRKYHNVEKNILVQKYTKNKKVLDLGFGRGGDIHKYKKAGTKYIWGVEPNRENYTEAISRLSREPDVEKIVKIIPTRAQETDKIINEMKEKADVVASFFSLTFFFENDTELNSLVDTISSGVRDDGYFIGTTMDGDATMNLLRGRDELKVAGCYNINKNYKDDKSVELSKSLQINLEDTIVKDQDEYLAFFSILKDKLYKKGFTLIETNMFSPPDTVDTRVKPLSSCFRSFVFKKNNTIPREKPKRNAWVWCVFGGKKYLTGAIPSVMSIKNVETKHDTVLMYTRDVVTDESGVVDERLLSLLRGLFSEIVQIDYIQKSCVKLRTAKQREKYDTWIDRSFTKWNILNLQNYNKTMFVDSDVIFLKNCDSLFDLSTPAGTFSSPWGSRYLEWGGVDISAYPVDHNTRVKYDTVTDCIKYNNNSMAVIGTMVLLSPSADAFQNFKSYLFASDLPYGYSSCNSGFDEQSISLFYSDVLKCDWTHIHHCYNYIPWKSNWRLDSTPPYNVPYVYHYFNIKPWDSDINQYSDLSDYYKYVIESIKYKSELKNYVVIDNPQSKIYVESQTLALQKPQTPPRKKTPPKKIHISALEVDEIEEIKTNNIDSSVLYRSGTVDDGSCFFHAVLKSIDIEYSMLSRDDKELLVKELRREMASSITFDEWRELSNGYLSGGLVYRRFSQWLLKNKHSDVLEKIDNNLKGGDIFEFMESAKDDINHNVYSAFLKNVEESYKMYTQKLGDSKTWVGYDDSAVDVFEYVSNYFGVNIYIMEGHSGGRLYKSAECSSRYQNRPSILILWVGSSHYESVGRLQNGEIVPVFLPNDPFSGVLNDEVCKR
jgi:hypothetical protein